MELENELKDLLGKLDAALKLAEEGLLKSERYFETKHGVEDKLKALSAGLDERNQLLIEKATSGWRMVPKPGVFVRSKEVADMLPLRQLITELLEGAKASKPIEKEVGGMKLPEGFAIGPLMFSANGKTASAIIGPAIIPFDYGTTNSLNRLNKTSLPPDEFQAAFNAQVEDLVSEMLIFFQSRLKPIAKINIGQFNSIDKCIKEYAKYSIDLEKLCDTNFLLSVDSVRGRKHHSVRRYDADYTVNGVAYDTVEKLRELNRRVHKEVYAVNSALEKTHKDYDVQVTQTPNSVSVSFTAKDHAFDLTRGGKVVPKQPDEELAK